MAVHDTRRSHIASATITVFLMLLAQFGVAQQSSAAPAAERTDAAPAQTPATGQDGAGCNSVQKPLNAGGASVVQAGESLQQKNWQPPGGEIEFTVKSFVQIPSNASVVVCFRWKTEDAKAAYFEVRPHRLDLSSDGKLLKVAAIVPSRTVISGTQSEYAVGLVPLADVRILAIPPAPAPGPDGKMPSPPVPTVDVSTSIGITNVFWAIALAIITVLLAYGGLTLVCHARSQLPGVSVFDPLCVIALPSGYASLSQFQVMIWTFVVAASAVYVMALSGDLIQVTTGTLVLLGISGAAAVGAKIHSEVQDPPAPVGEARQPSWSDLVVNEVVLDKDKNVVQREIDVTRVQMLFFTVITAFFVVLKVLSSYVIPEIPDGFQVLMGISNAVYMGSKVAQKSPAPTTK